MSVALSVIGGRTRGVLPPASDKGVSLPELLIVTALVVVLAGLAMPLTASSVDSGRARQAAGFIVARLRLAKLQAVLRSSNVAVLFDQVAGRWTFRMCADGNGNGLRRADVARGIDRCLEGPYDLGTLFPGVQIAIDNAIPGPDGEPSSADAVKFGRSDMASCSAGGGCTPGSVFLRSAKGEQYAVRITGVTGRLRLLHYERAGRAWQEL